MASQHSPTLDIVPQTDSTNADMLTRLGAGEAIAENYWLIADRQVQGRGRQGRQWLDAAGNFMGSTKVGLGPSDPPPSSLTFVAALAVYETLIVRIADPSALQIKWPNDIMLSGAKLCGILLEREASNVVVGIGVNLAAAPQIADREAKSLADVGGVADRDMFAEALALHFAVELRRWRQYGTQNLFGRWLAAAHPQGTSLSVHDSKGQRLTGAFSGLDPDGALLLRLDDGATRVIHAGDVMLEGKD